MGFLLMRKFNVLFLFILVLIIGSAALPVHAASSIGSAAGFASGCGGLTQAAIPAGAQRIVSGSTTIYIGYRQVSGNNQNSIAARFDSGVLVWCRDTYETGTPDSRGYGLFWDGANALYAVFSIDGGTASTTFNANGGWLNSYGSGGGSKVAVIALLDPATGLSLGATYLTSLNSNGRTNSFEVTGLNLTNNRLVVTANSWFSPRNTDRTAMTCSGGSPFAYVVELNPTLTSALWAEAVNCISKAPAPVLTAPTGTITNPYGNPNYTWTPNGAPGYELAVFRSDNLVTPVYYGANLPAATYCAATCTIEPVSQPSYNESARLYDGAHVVYIRARGGTWSAPYAFTLDAPAPPPVANLGVTGINTRRPTLNWSLTGNGVYATWFRLYLVPTAQFRVGAPTVDYWFSRAQLCGGVTGNSCSLQSGLDLNDVTQYSVYIQTRAPGGISEGGAQYNNGWSGADFMVNLPKPGVPQNIAVNINQGRPSIGWDDDAQALGFTVVIFNHTTGQWVYNAYHLKGNAGLSCTGGRCTLLTDTMIFANGSYSVYVNAVGNQAASAGGSFNNGYGGPTTPTNPGEPGDFVLDFGVPILVTNPTANFGGGSVNISFTGVPGATWYYVWIGTANGAQTNHYVWYSSTVLGCQNVGTCSKSIPLSLPPGTYYFAVQSAGPAGWLTTDGSANNGFAVSAAFPAP